MTFSRSKGAATICRTPEDMKAWYVDDPHVEEPETESVATVPRAPDDTRAPEEEPVSAQDTDSEEDSVDPYIPTEPVVSTEEANEGDDDLSLGDLMALAIQLPIPEGP